MVYIHICDGCQILDHKPKQHSMGTCIKAICLQLQCKALLVCSSYNLTLHNTFPTMYQVLVHLETSNIITQAGVVQQQTGY